MTGRLGDEPSRNLVLLYLKVGVMRKTGRMRHMVVRLHGGDVAARLLALWLARGVRQLLHRRLVAGSAN